MGSGGKKKTTMAKLARENRLRERRLIKQAKKDARKQASSDHVNGQDSPLFEAPSSLPTPANPADAALEPAMQPPAAADLEDAGETIARDAQEPAIGPPPGAQDSEITT